MSSFYTQDELKELGLKHFGKNVLISKKCSIYSAKNISIGNNVRIDDFCVLSGKIEIEGNIHIPVHNRLFAGNVGIYIENFAAISPNCSIYAISDDFNGNSLVGSCFPDEYRIVREKSVILKKYSAMGSSSTILPGVTLEEGSMLCSMSLDLKSTKAWKKYMGIPAKEIGDRSKKMIELADKYLKEQ